MPDYDAATALIVVDLQNDFADPAGGLSVTGGDEIVPLVNAEIAAAQAGGALIAYTQDWHPPHTPHFAQDGGIWPVHCVQDTWGAKLHPDLVVDGPIIRKGANGEDGYSGFTMRDPVTGETIPTELEGLLRERGHPARRDRGARDRLLRPCNRARRRDARLRDEGAARRHPRRGSRARGRRSGALAEMAAAGVHVEASGG